MMIENESSFVFKKINFHPTTSHGIFFGPNDRNADKTVYYTSGNKILGWSYETGLIFDKIPIESKKIRKVYENEGSLFILDVESNFYQFDFKTKQILARLKLNEGHESSTSIVNFAYSKTLNKFYFIDNQSNLIVVILRGTHPNCTMEINSKSKLNSENNSKLNTSIMVLNDDNKILMLATGRKLFLYNLTNDQQREIEFQKAISCAIFANENKIILGDYGGKIHTITNFNNRNYVLSSQHWHSHKVNCLEIDHNQEILFSAGKEGVIVLWNLKTETKNFIPRINWEIQHLLISKDSKYLLCLCEDKSIKVINLFTMNVISELPAISPGADKILKYKQENEDMLMLINSSLERLQLFNLNKRLIVMDSIIHKKNFISSTEVEQINNRRLMNVEVARPSNDYIATYEEIKDEADPNFLISMLKFWKFTNYTLELLCVADNPHKNERVKQIRSSNSMFLTIGESSFKVWKLTEKKFNCIFTGSYRRDNVTDVIFTSETKCISLHGGCRLVEWDLSTKKFTRIHFLPQVYSKMLYFDEEQTILLYDEKTICALKNWELIWFEEFKEHSINKVTYESKEDFLLYLQKDKSKDEVIIYKTSIANKKINQCFFVRKFNLSYIDSWNGSKFVIANTKRDLFITGKKNYYLTKEKEWNVRNSFDLELPKVRIDIKENLESSSKTRTFKSISGGDIFEQNLDSLKLKK